MRLIFEGFVLMVLVGLAAVGLVFAARRFLPKEQRESDVEAIGLVFAVVGVLYAIILAFVVIDVWQKMTLAEEHVYREANALVEQYRYASTLPAVQQSEIQRLGREYAQHVVKVEWPQMRDHNRPGVEGDGILDDLRAAVADSHPGQGDEQAKTMAYEAAVNQGQVITEAREARLASATQGVPAIMWLLLIGGGLLMVGFVYVFEVGGVVTQSILAVGLMVMAVLLVWSIYQMEYPFSRELRIGPEAFEFALARFTQIARGG